jgi:hypothetical protein
VRERVPGLTTRLILSGPETATFRQYVESEHLMPWSSLDSTGALLRGLGRTHPPVTLLVSAEGRVLWLDDRRGSASYHYTVGRLIPELASALSSDTTAAP